MGYYILIPMATITNVCDNDNDDDIADNDASCDGGDRDDVCCFRKLALHFYVLLGSVERGNEAIMCYLHNVTFIMLLPRIHSPTCLERRQSLKDGNTFL